MRLVYVLALWLLAPMLFAHPAVQTIAAARVADAAQAALQALPLEEGTRLDMRVVGQPADVQLPAGSLRIEAQPPAGRWPRSRVAVSVKLSAGHAIRTETVWFAVKAARSVAVYGSDTAQGTPAGAIRVRQAEVDTARMHGHPVGVPVALEGQRLRRPVLAGAPVMAEDFEPVPDVDARQPVTVLVRYGAVRMQTRGTALSAGDAGQWVGVLATGADSPVQAQVTGKGVVEVAR